MVIILGNGICDMCRNSERETLFEFPITLMNIMKIMNLTIISWFMDKLLSRLDFLALVR